LEIELPESFPGTEYPCSETDQWVFQLTTSFECLHLVSYDRYKADCPDTETLRLAFLVTFLRISTFLPPSRKSSTSVLWSGCGRQKKCHTAAPPPAGVWRRM